MELTNTTGLFKSACNRLLSTFKKHLTSVGIYLSKIFTLLGNTILFSDDSVYRIYFEHSAAPKIYRYHMSTGYKSCVFCNHLKKSLYEKHNFICDKSSHEGYYNLLPGPFPFAKDISDANESCDLPWLFRTPCSHFNKLNKRNYFRNFTYFNTSVTVSYYEYLEGLYTGICDKKRPCNICASISLEIYKKCFEKGYTSQSTPCSKITKHLN